MAFPNNSVVNNVSTAEKAKGFWAEALQVQALVSATIPRSELKEASVNEADSPPSVYSLLSAAPLQPFQQTFEE
jgi:hypothetical protein